MSGSGRLRVAVSCNNYPPEFAGGTERVVQALCREHLLAGHDCLVIAGSEVSLSEGEVRRECVDGIEVHRLALAEDEGYHLRVARPRLMARIQEILQAEQVEVLHVHHWSHLADTQVQVARELGLGVVVTLHDMWSSCPRFFRRPVGVGIACPEDAGRAACVSCVAADIPEDADTLHRALRARDQNMLAELQQAHVLCAPSADCARACATHLPWTETPAIQVLPHGLLDELHAAVPREAHLPLRVGTFGNLNQEKGVDLLLEAMAGLPAELHCFGAVQADFAADLQRRAEELSVALTLHGPYGQERGAVAADQHPAAQLDLAVFPSRCRETYGLVVDEALHQGTPVLVSGLGALPERVSQGGGRVVQGHEVQAWHAAIRALLEDRGALADLRQSIPSAFPQIRETARHYRELYLQALDAARNS